MTDTFVYEDWTRESEPRCFYVGKGTANRVRAVKRNKHHARVTAKHGLDRRIVFGPVPSEEAATKEIELIAQHKTYVYGEEYEFGCNYTSGGEGTSGAKLSDQHKRAISLANSHPKSAETVKKMKLAASRRASDPTWRRKVSEARVGIALSEVSKQKISEKLKGRALSSDHRASIAASMSKPEVRERAGVKNRRENMSAERLARLSEASSKPVAQCSADGSVVAVFSSINEAATAVGVTGSAVSHALRGWTKTCRGYVWKHVASVTQPEVGEPDGLPGF